MGKNKKTKAAAPPEKKEARTKMPDPMADNIIDVQFGKKDLAELVDLLSVSAQTYEMLAKEVLKDNNEKAFKVLSNRMKLSQDYAAKLALIHNMGETSSRELH